MKRKIGNLGKFNGIGYFAVGNNELENQPVVGSFVICPNCGKKHKVQYGKVAKTKEVSKSVGFVKCRKDSKLYLVAVNEKLI